METLDVLADPAAMKAIQAACNGESTYRPLDLEDENFDLWPRLTPRVVRSPRGRGRR